MSDEAAPKPWQHRMPDDQFDRMKSILSAPSPIGLEAAMTEGVLAPMAEGFMPAEWKIHRFRGNAGIVIDTAPAAADAFTVMLIGHADKIRLQVRSIGSDGKIWVNSDSFLPVTLLGEEVLLYSEDPEEPGTFRVIEGGTIEGIGAAHFASADVRSGRKGIKAEDLFLELQIHGKEKEDQVKRLGIRSGDPILLKRKIRRGFSPDTFFGAYLDNGLGCFVMIEVARLLAEAGGLKNVRFLGAAAAYEEIGRFGSRVLAQEFRPDVVIGADVSHDLAAAPGVGDKRYTPVAMGEGFSMQSGAVTSAYLNKLLAQVAIDHEIPVQRILSGRDTGTDAMAAVLASIDAAAASIGFPIRNMHTSTEIGHTGDVLAAIHATFELLRSMDAMNDGAGIDAGDFRRGHPRLDGADALEHRAEN
ncbi:MAG: M28 family peptidase [Planctomycetota bacterium]|jgi:endoglucanase